VQRIIRAYDEHKRVAEEQMSLSLEGKAANGNGNGNGTMVMPAAPAQSELNSASEHVHEI
jgi:hypothetical protein